MNVAQYLLGLSQNEWMETLLVDTCLPTSIISIPGKRFSSGFHLLTVSVRFCSLHLLPLSLFGDVLPSFVRTCQKTVVSSCWWGRVSTSSRTTRMSSALTRVTSSAWLVRRMAAGGKGCSMAGLGGFLATMSVRSRALVGTSTTFCKTFQL